MAYGPRYAAALRGTRLGFSAPTDVAAFEVVERLPGSATTDFGAPGAAPANDAEALERPELRRLTAILEASWRAFDRAAAAAEGATLATGPRGGGRTLEKIVGHVAEAEGAYLRAVGRKPTSGEPEAIRADVLEALEAGARGELAERGPRGGRLWTARYLVRRAAWHVLDHAWEIEDRSS